jgi:hypothetical protein
MARISYLPTSTNSFRQMLGHNPQLLKAFNTLSSTLRTQLSLPPELKEEVRANLAVVNECSY